MLKPRLNIVLNVLTHKSTHLPEDEDVGFNRVMLAS